MLSKLGFSAASVMVGGFEWMVVGMEVAFGWVFGVSLHLDADVG
jgi:hypothetical protein